MNVWPNWVDLIVITFFLRGCYVGFSRGLFTEILYGVGAVVVTIFSINYAGLVVEWLRPWLWMSPTVANMLVFWGLFLTLFLIVRFVIRWICTFVKWERLHWLFQGTGLVLGALRGLWWAGLVVVALFSSGFDYMQQSIEARSIVGPRFLSISQRVLNEVSAQFPGAEHRGKQLIPAFKSGHKGKRGR